MSDDDWQAEIAALQTIATALERLPHHERERVIHWAVSRFGISLPPPVPPPPPSELAELGRAAESGELADDLVGARLGRPWPPRQP